MPLHPRLAERLEFEAEQYPDLTSVPTEEAREAVREMARETDRLAGGPPSVALLRETSFRGPDGRVRLRVYLPVGPEQIPGVVAYFHSGGWIFGDLDTQDGICREITNRSGAAVVSVDYRRAPEHRFPAALGDAEAAVRWLAEPETAERLGYDPARLAVAGDDVGGNLALGVGRRLRTGGPPLAALILVCPVLGGSSPTASRAEFATGYGLEQSFVDWSWQQYLPHPDLLRDPDASPAEDPELAALPPVLLVSAECDPLRDDAAQLGDRLRAAGVPVTESRYAGMIHGFLDYRGLVEEAGHALEEIGTALRSALRPRPTGEGPLGAAAGA